MTDKQQDVMPVAWRFELARSRNLETNEPCNWGGPTLAFFPPKAGDYQRNVTPLMPVADHLASLARVEAERDEAQTELGKVVMACKPGYRKSPSSHGVREMRVALETAEAALAECRKGDGLVPQVTTWPTLKAMAHNYTNGHSWDHLDTDACLEAVEEIQALRAQITASQKREAGMRELLQEILTCMRNGDKFLDDDAIEAALTAIEGEKE